MDRMNRSLGPALAVLVLALASCTGGDGSVAPTAPPDSGAPTVAPLPPSTAPAAHASMAPLPSQPDGVPFPGDEWPTGPWPDGVDVAAIDAATDSAFGDGPGPRVRAFVVVLGGRLVYERYSPSLMDRPETLFPSFSIAKSVTTTLVGILVREHRLDVSLPAAIPEWQEPGDPRAAITLDDLLRMSSGLEWTQDQQPGSDQDRLFQSSDAGAFAASKRVVHDPGETFNYSSGDTTLIDRILADEIGSGQAFQAFMDAELLGPIGIAQMDLRFDEAGTWHGSAFADATATDMARLGLLYLRDGVWDGERILPEGWVDYVRTPSRSNPEYGGHWWLDPERPGEFYAIGSGGQVVGVVPQYDLVFVQLATDSNISLALSNVLMAELDAALG